MTPLTQQSPKDSERLSEPEIEIDNLGEDDNNDDVALVDDSEMAPTKQVEAKLGINRYLIEDVWAHGTQLLEKDKTWHERQMTFDRKARKQWVNLIIMKCIEESPNSTKYTPKAEDETTNIPGWT